MPLTPPNPAEFINVDLEIESPAKLDRLATELGERVFVLHHGPVPGTRRHLLSVETARQHRDPDANLRAFCALVERLSPAARRLWDRARKRFDVGYRLSAANFSSQFAFRPGTLERVATLGAALAVTCYRKEEANTATAAS